MEELTEQGYKTIETRIILMEVPVPSGKTLGELHAWMDGYSECQQAILQLLDDLRTQNPYGR